ncbi:hypothetical protein FRD01_20485 [Microvenator marinus]|uniref:Secreted protein n=1 Tax=Microvenator marinus TaxID=2600177 RepID=A0A5B8Y1M3_9DELT|nr:hypothetical protein [Microvenator marinus]QED29569.1 hypothetical protein FRD01_20485 [Microvenator marinus]
MIRPPGRRVLILALVMTAASVLTACSVSVAGGVGGLGLTLLLVGLFAFQTTQSGCADDDDKDPDVGPCLSIEYDMGWDLAEDMEDDAYVGPCLSPPPPDMGEDANQDMEDDASIGPCLSMPPPDMNEDMQDADMALKPASDKAQILAKLEADLPADVLERLKNRKA